MTALDAIFATDDERRLRARAAREAREHADTRVRTLAYDRGLTELEAERELRLRID